MTKRNGDKKMNKALQELKLGQDWGDPWGTSMSLAFAKKRLAAWDIEQAYLDHAMMTNFYSQ